MQRIEPLILALGGETGSEEIHKMEHPFDIYHDDTMACLLTDYVIWANRQGDLDYHMPEELRIQIQKEVQRISDIFRNRKEK